MGLASRALLGRGSIYTLSTVLSMGSALLMLPFLTRILSLGEFGIVALATTFGQLVALVANLALPTAITRAYFMDAGGVHSASRLVIDGALFATAITSVLALSSSWWWEPLLGAEWSGTAVLAVAYGGLVSVVQLLLAYLRAVDRPWAFVATASGSSVGGVLAGLILCLLVDRSAGAYLAGICALHVVTIAFAVYVAGLEPSGAGAKSGYARRALAIALPTIPHLLALQGFAVGLRAIAQAESGADAVARFHVSYTVGSLAIVLLSALNNAWAPLVFKADPQNRPAVLRETTRTILQVTGAVSAVTALASPLLLAVMAPGEYDVATLVAPTVVVAVAGPAYALYLAHMHVITAGARTTGLAVTTPLAALLALIAVAALVRAGFGLFGIALGVPLFYVAVAAAGRYLAKRVGPTSIPYRWAAAAMSLTIACGVAPILLPRTLLASVLLAILSVGIVACGVLVVLRGLRSGAELNLRQ